MNLLNPSKPLRKILVIKPSALGDIIHSLPFLHAVKGSYPESQIHWVVARAFHEILLDHPMIHTLWVIDKDQWKEISRLRDTAFALKALFTDLRRERFDTVIDLQGLFRSGMIAAATGSKRRIGFEEAREGSRFVYTQRVIGGKEIHAVDRYLKVAAALGCDVQPPRFPFPAPPEHSPVLDSLPERYAVIAPSAGSAAKKWPAARMGELASRLSLPSFVVAGNADVSLAREVVDASKGRAISLAGRTNLKELVALIGNACFLVCPDTGPMHIAAALNVPVFAVFGPTSPVRTGPYGTGHTVIRPNLPCSPCYRRKKCDNWKCMDAITVEQVLRAIREKGF